MKQFIAALIFQIKDYDTGESYFIPTTATMALEDETSYFALPSKTALDTFLSTEETKALEQFSSEKPGRIGVQLTSVSFLPHVITDERKDI